MSRAQSGLRDMLARESPRRARQPELCRRLCVPLASTREHARRVCSGSNSEGERKCSSRRVMPATLAARAPVERDRRQPGGDQTLSDSRAKSASSPHPWESSLERRDNQATTRSRGWAAGRPLDHAGHCLETINKVAPLVPLTRLLECGSDSAPGRAFHSNV